MNIDRIARAMTGRRGPSGPAFTARVMATIHGRPRPDFTSRVMRGVARADAAGSHGGWRAAWVFASAASLALALALGASILRGNDSVVPALPHPPRLITDTSGLRATGARLLPDRGPARASAVRATRPGEPPAEASPVDVTEALPDLPPIYVIPALEGPAALALRRIDPAPPVIPALPGPAPLTLPALPEAPAASQKASDRDSKEKP